MLHRLFSFLLNYLIFGSTMFLAAGAAVADVGGGGGDAGGDVGGPSGDAGAGGDGSGDDNVSGGDDVAGAATDGNSTRGDTASGDPNASVDIGNGQQAPAKFKKLFDAAKTLGLEKEVKQLYFSQQRIQKAFGAEGVNGALKLAQTVEQLGGVEGIEQLRGDNELYQQDAENFESNPQKWIADSFAENPDQSLKAWQHSIELVAEKFPEQYDHVAGKMIASTLNNFHLNSRELDRAPIHDAYTLLTGMKDNPQAQNVARLIAGWYQKQLLPLVTQAEDLAAKIPEKKVDARTKELDDRAAKVTEQEMGVRYTQVNATAFPALKSYVAGSLQAIAKENGLDLDKLATDYPGEFRAMMNEIHGRIKAAAVKDDRFIGKYAALVKKNDIRRATAAINRKHELIAPDIAREVAAGYGFMKGKAKPNAASGKPGAPNAGAQSQDQGWTRVTAKPAQRLIDYTKTTPAMQLDGKYILQDGKKVVVDYGI